MKKIWKTMLAAMLMSLAACLFAGTAVSAETVSGEIVDGFTWSYDTETKALTLKGEGDIPQDAISDPSPWVEYRDSIQHVYLDGIASLTLNYSISNAALVSGKYGTISWEMDMANKTLQVNGTGSADNGPWDAFADRASASYEVTLGDQITAWNSSTFYVHTLHIGAGYSADYFDGAYVVASPDNPDFSTYEGAVYTKGFDKLLRCEIRENPKLHPDVKIIAANAFPYTTGTIIIPWGVTTIEEGAFQIYGSTTQIVLPDTLTSVKNLFPGGKDCHILFIYSKSNEAALRDLGNQKDSFDNPVSKVVDSLAEYYPDHYAQTPEASEPSAPASSGSGDAKPVDKPSGGASAPSQPPTESFQPAEPSSKPADTSKPAQTASKPASQPQAESSAEQEKPSSATSESSAAAESSLSAESSLPEESILESSISESNPESSDELYEEMSREETPERTSGGVNWIIPLVFALGAMAAVAAVVLFIIWKKK